MNYNQASFSCTALQGTNKLGTVKPDADGYYNDVVLGALNFYNSAGAFYTYDSTAKEIFQSSSSFMRRVAAGSLRGEYGHPYKQPGMNNNEYVLRLMTVQEDKVSHHIRNVRVDYTAVKDKNGNACIAILGSVKPSGPFGPALKDSFESKDENVCFSIRALTSDSRDGSLVTKGIRQIVTWDYVNEPGISVANKYASPALEALQEQAVTPAILKSLRKRHEEQPETMSMESAAMLEEAVAVMAPLGYDSDLKHRPAYLRW